eukprot:5459524-Amphidinium_carterae.2
MVAAACALNTWLQGILNGHTNRLTNTKTNGPQCHHICKASSQLWRDICAKQCDYDRPQNIPSAETRLNKRKRSKSSSHIQTLAFTAKGFTRASAAAKDDDKHHR